MKQDNSINTSNKQGKTQTCELTIPSLVVSSSPHLHGKKNVRSVMWDVVIALSPALVAGVFLFGLNALVLTIYGIVAAVLTEVIIQKLRKKPVTIYDGSAIITGMLVSFNVHANVSWWIPVAGSVFAIAIGKHVFGGLGNNILNPALLGRAFLMASWPTQMTSNWPITSMLSMNGITQSSIEITSTQITQATPLSVAQTLRDPLFIEKLDESGSQVANEIFQTLTDFPTLINMF